MRVSLGGIRMLSMPRLAAVLLWVSMAGHLVDPIWSLASGDGLPHDPIGAAINLLLLGILTVVCVGLYRHRRRAYVPALLLAVSLTALNFLAFGGIGLFVANAPGTIALALLLAPSGRAPFWPSASSGQEQRLVIIATAIAALEMAITVAIGFTAPLQALQLPGIAYLTALDHCCGYSGAAFISDELMPHWQGLTRIGVPGLFVANAAAYALVLLGFRRRPQTDAA